MAQIIVNNKIRFGKPIVEGTRITVEEIIGAIAGGMTFKEIQEEYSITKEQIKAALEYVNEILSEENVGAINTSK